MKKIKNTELKKRLILLLSEFDAIADSLNIKYTIYGGSLLGSVRHNGIIPWDDDIDVAVSRKDYSTLVEAIVTGQIDTKNRFENIHTQKSFRYLYTKMIDTQTLQISPRFEKKMGVFLDIFPMDYVPVDADAYKNIKEQIKNKYIKSQFSNLRSFLSSQKYMYAAYKLMFRFDKYIKQRKLGTLNELLIKLEKDISASEKTKRIAMLSIPMGSLSENYEEEDFFEVERVEFEGIEINRVVNYDNILRQQYGEYLTLPPVSERVSHSEYVYYKK